MAILIEVKNEYMIAQNTTREEGMWLGTRGWWYYGDRTKAPHSDTLRALGVALHSRYLPAAQLTTAAALFGAQNVEWTPAARAVVASAAENLRASRDAGSAETLVIPAPEGFAYRPYQLAGVKFALSAWADGRRGVLIGDEMGLGKTMQGIGAMRVLDAKRTLVLCLTSLKRNWMREIGKWWPEAPVSIVDSEGTLLASHADRVTILSYSSIVGAHPRAKALREALLAQHFDLCVLDEVHVLKNSKRQASKFVLGAYTSRGVREAAGLIERCEKSLLLTGTPIQNRVRESIPLIRACGGFEGTNSVADSEGRFLFRYCGPQKTWTGSRNVTTFDGATKLDELQNRLRGTGLMIRRLKAQVATELPPKVRSLLRLEGGHERDPLDAHTPQEIDFEAGKLQGVSASFLEMAAYRAALAKAKAPAVIEHVQSLLDDDRKVLVFGHHETMLDALEKAFALQSIRIDGKTPEQDRQGLVDLFQLDASKRCALISTRAGGTGLTLTAADVVVFAEADWNPAQCLQAEDRAHRIGQTADVVTVQYLVLDGTLDAHVVETMIRKMDVADRALDRKVDATPAPAPKPVVAARPVRRVTVESRKGNFTHLISNDSKAAIAEAFMVLRGNCDGASSRDDVGFNGMDARSEFVQSLCSSAIAGRLSDKQAAWCLQILSTYRNTQIAYLAERLWLSNDEE